jgi:hypothetical protein
MKSLLAIIGLADPLDNPSRSPTKDGLLIEAVRGIEPLHSGDAPSRPPSLGRHTFVVEAIGDRMPGRAWSRSSWPRPRSPRTLRVMTHWAQGSTGERRFTPRRLRIEIFGVFIPLTIALSAFVGYRLFTDAGTARVIDMASLIAGLGIMGVAVLLQSRRGTRPLKAGGWVVLAVLLGASQVVTSTRTGQTASVAFFDGIVIALLVRSILLGHFRQAIRGRETERIPAPL